MDLLPALRSTAARAGLAAVRVAGAEPFDATRREMERRAEAGWHGGLGFTYRDPAVAADVRRSYPWARRLVVAAWGYLPDAGSPGPGRPGMGRVARFATADHYRPLRAGLEALAACLRTAGQRAEVLCDDSRLVDRAAAARAGLGWWGKSTMVLCPGWGPWVLLGCVATDAPLAASAPSRRDCGRCNACLEACPTGALIAPGVLDARRCLARITQAAGPIPEPFRPALGDRVYGCDDCLEACPPGRRRLQATTATAGRIDLAALLRADDASLRARWGHWYIPGRRLRYLRRNALVATGNSGGHAARAAAAGYLGSPDLLLAEHAAWALAQRPAGSAREGGGGKRMANAPEQDAARAGRPCS